MIDAGEGAPAAGECGTWEGYADTLRRLRIAQKSGQGPAYLRYVNRRLGRPFAAGAYHLGLTPNTVTAVSAAITFSGIALLAVVRPSMAVGVVVTFLLLLGFALDSADGQLARLRGGGSLSGEWLDHVVDAVKVSSIHLAVLLSLYRGDDLGQAWLLVPLGFSVVGAVAFFSNQLHEQLLKNAQGGVRTDGDRPAAASLLLLPTDYGLLCMTFLLLGSAQAFIAAYGLLFVLRAAHVVVSLRRQFTAVQRIDGQRS
jgi:phosphatidylglycerophosphate synthase